MYSIVVRLFCRIPKTKEEFVKTAELLGIEWDINDALSIEEFESCF